MRLATPTAILLLIGAACGDAGEPIDTTIPPTTITIPDTTTTVPETFPVPTGPGDIVVQLDYGVNQPDPLPIAAAYPFLTIYGDGRVIFEDRSADRGALPPLFEARLAPEGIQQLIREAARRGALDPLDSYGFPPVADADSVAFVFDAGTGPMRFGVYALGVPHDPDNPFSDVTEEQEAARRELSELESTLRGWQRFVGEHIVEEPRPYEFDTLLVMGDDAYAVLASTDDRGLPPEVLDTAAEYDTRVVPLICAEVSGDLLATALPVVEAAERYRDWAIGETAWRLEFRPVLPHEPGCAIVPEQ